ncbi:nitrous oxide reductase accessory protein NosL [Kistimonas asteriae]|uniref:nitrous oxide reductase accessory protein NosL n=1 Tax=Kistimonas asteriae TaxID=517724 RepID=UPI001BA6F318|nr:nitrous oxide reductase accessory protein NosL [Kistimonas asteriae]
MSMINRKVMTLCAGLLLVVLVGCNQEPEHSAMQHAMPIEAGDTCHLCGMIIRNHPGPKGELYVNGSPSIKRFCSTRDLFSWLLQPENQPNVQTVFVHDMAKSSWETPDDNAFIEAKDAWFVAGSSKSGAMGATLSSFASEGDATAFARDFGGEVLRFESVTLELLGSLAMPGEGRGMHGMVMKHGAEHSTMKDMPAADTSHTMNH